MNVGGHRGPHSPAEDPDERKSDKTKSGIPKDPGIDDGTQRPPGQPVPPQETEENIR